MSTEIDVLCENFEYNNLTICCLLSNGNPGSITVLVNLLNNIDSPTLIQLFKELWNKQIIGSRLWYIYKNECNQDMNQLIQKDLTPFDNNYFYEKFEKYL
jgi:hypothetical protein